MHFSTFHVENFLKIVIKVTSGFLHSCELNKLLAATERFLAIVLSSFCNIAALTALSKIFLRGEFLIHAGSCGKKSTA